VLDMQYAKTSPEPVSERTPRFRNIHFSNITAQTKQAVFLNGLAEMPIEDISFNDIQFDAETGITIKEAKNIALHQVRVTTKQGPAIIAEQVRDLEINGFKTFMSSDSALISLTNVQNLFLHGCWAVNKTAVFLMLTGRDTRDIRIMNNNLQNVLKPIVKDSSVQVPVVEE
jgi:hypothetical protein